jgi:hypothetical protein
MKTRTSLRTHFAVLIVMRMLAPRLEHVRIEDTR